MDLPPISPPTSQETPRTPLTRGVCNYFPKGLKLRRHDFSFSFNQDPRLLPEDSPRSLAPLHVNRPPPTAHARIRTIRHGSDVISRHARLPKTAGATRQFSLGPVVPFRRDDVFYPTRDVIDLPRSLLDDDVININDDVTKPLKKLPGIILYSISHREKKPTDEPQTLVITSQPSDVTSSSNVTSSPPLTSRSSIVTSSKPSSPPCLSMESSFAKSLSSVTSHELKNDVIDGALLVDKEGRNGFKVFVRVKPLDDQDIAGNPSNRLRCVKISGDDVITLNTRPSTKKENNHNKHDFMFDHVLDEASSQRDVYDVTTQPIVPMLLEGHHCCVITYGSPGSGKSHALFAIDKELNPSAKVHFTMSFIQLYNEKFYDILDPSATDNIKFTDNFESSTLEGVTEWPVDSIDDVTKQLRRNPNRVRDAGRSHTIFTLYFNKTEDVDQQSESTAATRTTTGKLDFVDLVGVNRATKHSTHDSLGNAKAVKSLSAFASMVWGLTKTEQTTTSYKESKLTRYLHEALGGNCVTRLLVTASACPNQAHETLSCLQFGSRAMLVSNQPLPNVVTEVKKIENEFVEEKISPLPNSPSFMTSQSPTMTSQSSLPPINMKTMLSSTATIDQSHHFDSIEDKSTSTEKSDQSEAKRKKEKRRSSKENKKRKGKGESDDVTKPSYWQINSESGGQVVALPHINNHHDCDVTNSDDARKKRRRSKRDSTTSQLDLLTSLGSRPCSPTELTSDPMMTSSMTSSCCLQCKDKEKKLRRDYDRMIMFSKKDRDSKQQKIEDLEVQLRKSKSDASSSLELQILMEERVKDRQLTGKLQKDLKESQDLCENLKLKLSNTVEHSELSKVNELRRNDLAAMDEQRTEIEKLELNLAEQTRGASKMLQKKSEQFSLLQKENNKLKAEAKEKEAKAISAALLIQSDLNKAVLERDKVTSQYETIARETASTSTKYSKEISELKEKNKGIEKEKAKLKLDLEGVSLKLTTSQSEISNLKSKLTSKGHGVKCSDAETNTDDIRSKANDVAFSVTCVRCAAAKGIESGQFGESPDVRDAELRLLLLQDAKNREVLVQLKRERNLLRDVMKIMYARQWFSTEGNTHVKRTLNRVGIDLRDLEVIKKKD